MLGKVGSLGAKTSVKKHLFEAIFKKVEMGGEDFLLLLFVEHKTPFTANLSNTDE